MISRHETSSKDIIPGPGAHSTDNVINLLLIYLLTLNSALRSAVGESNGEIACASAISLHFITLNVILQYLNTTCQ